MAKLIINPGTPQARAFDLKAGNNFVGRGFANDLKLEDASVSTNHAQIVVDGGTVSIKDLGSTNGTYINRSQVREGFLLPGQSLRLGGVEMLLELEGAAAPASVAAPVPLAPAISLAPSQARPAVASPVAAGPAPAVKPSIRISRPAAPEPPPVDLSQEEEPPMAPPVSSGVPTGPRSCKFHPKTPARFLCRKCNQSFCDFCVTAREAGKVKQKLCRTCGVELVPLHVQVVRPVQRSFFVTMPGAFIYPFRGMGSVVLVLATFIYAGLGFLSGGVAIGAKVMYYGFLFLFMQNIIFCTTSDENEPLSLPDMSGVIGAAFTLFGTIALSFGIPIGLFLAKLFGGMDIPIGFVIGTAVLGCLYFPMCFLVVAIKDSIMAGNPLIVIPSILKVPFQYLVASLLLMAVLGIRFAGSYFSSDAGGGSMATTDGSALIIWLGVQALWAFGSVYLLTVNIRILGLFYNSYKEKLAWF